MTLPIIPGPFSFLAGAGQAAGAIGSAMTEQDRYKQALAAQNAGFLEKLIAAGVVAPETLASPETQKLFGQAGLPAIQPGQVDVPTPTVVGRRAKSELSRIPEGTTQSQLAAGVPTEAAASVEEAKGAEAETALRGLAEIITPAQLRQYKGLLNPQAAEIAEKVFLEKSKTELQNQDPLRLEAQMQAEIRKSVLKRLPKDPAFAKLADYVAIGALGYLLQDMETSTRLALGSKAQNTEKIRLVTAITSQASTAYRQAFTQWQQGLKDAEKAALGIQGADMTQPEQTKRLNEVDADYVARHPMPQLLDFLDQGLEAGGLSQSDFQEAFRSLVHVPGATEPPGSNFQAVLKRHKEKPYTNAEIDAATTLTPAQKAQLKSMNKGSGSSF